MTPVNTLDLFEMLYNTQGLHSYPEIKDDVITWKLYVGATIQAAVGKKDAIIDIIRDNFLKVSYMHWHLDTDDIYDELCLLGKAGNILVLRKHLFCTETFYMGKAENYPFTSSKKWHWGRLVYLSQSG